MDAGRDRRVILGIRPSDFEDAEVGRGEAGSTMEVVPDVIEDLGSEVHVIFTVDAPPVVREETVAAGPEEAPIEGEPDGVLPRAEGKSSFVASVDARTAARVGRPLRLAVDPARFHFFDPESGRTIGEPRPVTASA